jgi:hypothetical protein
MDEVTKLRINRLIGERLGRLDGAFLAHIERQEERINNLAKAGEHIAKAQLEILDRVEALEAGVVKGAPEPAPQAQQGVTVEELACILSEAPNVRGLRPGARAAWLLKHPRLGPLLRGAGVLPEEPPAAIASAVLFAVAKWLRSVGHFCAATDLEQEAQR